MLIDYLKQNIPGRMKVLLALYELGMADKYQLSAILNKKLHNIHQTIKRINALSDREKVIMFYRRYQQPWVYSLGPLGWKIIMDYLQGEDRYREKSKFQIEHYRGVTGILARLFLAMGYDQAINKIEWYNTQEATECLKYPWSLARWEDWKELRREVIRPDARLVINDHAFWIEFDNETEPEKQIKEKYRMYIRTLGNLPPYTGLHNPVIWVTKSAKRKDRMKQWWRLVREEPEFGDYKWKPPMGFFVEGEETTLLQNHTKQTE